MRLVLASASGNSFGYLRASEVPEGASGPDLARRLCARGEALGLDGLFILQDPEARPWRAEHWDPDGAHTFCSNGLRAALAVEGAPEGAELEGSSCGTPFALRRREGLVGLRMPQGEGFGLQEPPLSLEAPAGFGFVGNPQLVLEVPAVKDVDLAALAPPLRHHPAFPEGTNVNVVEVVAPGRARIRSWERGVEGETLCCGTGCAVVAAWLARRTGLSRWRLQPAGRDAGEVEGAVGPEHHPQHVAGQQ